MIFGFNTDVPVGASVYHLQTEDRGAKNPVIESVVYTGGQIVGQRQTPYNPAEMAPERIEELVRRQHKELVEAIRSGAWAPAADTGGQPQTAGYQIKLLNTANLRNHESLCFQLSICCGTEKRPAGAVGLQVRWLVGEAAVESRSLCSNADGSAEVSFPLPEGPSPSALLILAQGPAGRTLAKFLVSPQSEPRQ